MKLWHQLGTACALLMGTCAFAQSSPVYIGITGGYARADVNCAGTTRCDRSSGGVQAFAGVMLAPFVGVELQLHDYGKVTASVTGIDAEIRSTGAGGGVLLIGPIAPQWDLFARLGAARNRAKVTLAGAVSGSVTDSATKAYYGLGGAYKMTPNLSLRLQWDGSTFKPAGENMDTSMLSVGVAFQF